MESQSIQHDLAERLVASVTQAGSARTSPALCRALLQSLALGKPVSVAQLASAAGHPVAEAENALVGWPDTEYDEQGRIVGWGLTLRPTPHRLIVESRQLYTWCALDTLFFPAVIGRRAQIESCCYATGVPIRLTVDPADGVSDLDPATAVVSLVIPEKMSSVRTDFCNPGRFFATADAARDWQAEHPGMHVLPVAGAYHAARPLSESLLLGTGDPLA
jgi:alkylmercury lyase